MIAIWEKSNIIFKYHEHLSDDALNKNGTILETESGSLHSSDDVDAWKQTGDIDL